MGVCVQSLRRVHKNEVREHELDRLERAFPEVVQDRLVDELPDEMATARVILAG